MAFFTIAADLITKLVVSLASRTLGETMKDAKNRRRMERLVADSVDRIVEQAEGYLTGEKVSDHRKKILIMAICAKLQPLAEDPQAFFASDLDGPRIYKACHPDGIHPQEIQEEQLSQFYSVLFPQIAHFLAGSRLALAEWQAEGLREEFKRLRQIAEEIRRMNEKIADLPNAVANASHKNSGREQGTLFRELAQVILNNLLLKLDLSPLRPERALHGSLGDHFVVPAFRERRKASKPINDSTTITERLTAPGSRTIVHGGPGVGKTTWALWLQSRLLQADPIRLALVFRLRQHPDFEHQSLLDLLRTVAGPHIREGLTDQVLRQWLSKGQILVVLDGFDEISEERRDAVEKWATEFSIVAKVSAVIVTSRPLQSRHLEHLKRPWRQWDLLPFDENRIIEFIERWHRYLPEGELSIKERAIDARELAKSFLVDPSLRSLSDTPLMLGTLLFVHHRDQRLPSGRVDLYERYISAMLGLRDAGLGIMARSTKLTDKEKRLVLSHIAIYFQTSEISETNDHVMRTLVSEALERYHLDESIDRLLAALSERSGLVVGPGAWSFSHKTVAEFLVAETICDGIYRLENGRRLDRMELWTNRYNDSWTTVLFFWAGKTSPRELEEFLRQLLDDRETGVPLGLGLLDDQGHRLELVSRREIALCLLSYRAPQQVGAGRAVCLLPALPVSEFAEISARVFKLTGLAYSVSTNAIRRFLREETLRPKDLELIHTSHHEDFRVALLWLLSAGEHLGQSVEETCAVASISRSYVAFARVYYILKGLALVGGDGAEQAIGLWRKTYPDYQNRLPLLILGSVFAEYSYRTPNLLRIGALLLQQASEVEVPHEHLVHTFNYKHFNNPHFDLLQKVSELIKAQASDLDLSEEQSRHLLEWIKDLISKRTSLAPSDGRAASK